MELRLYITHVMVCCFYDFENVQGEGQIMINVQESTGSTTTTTLTFNQELSGSFYSCLDDLTKVTCKAEYDYNNGITTITTDEFNPGEMFWQNPFTCENKFSLKTLLCKRLQLNVSVCDLQGKYQSFRRRNNTNSTSGCPGIVWENPNEGLELSLDYEFCDDMCNVSSVNTQVTPINETYVTNYDPIVPLKLPYTSSTTPHVIYISILTPLALLSIIILCCRIWLCSNTLSRTSRDMFLSPIMTPIRGSAQPELSGIAEPTTPRADAQFKPRDRAEPAPRADAQFKPRDRAEPAPRGNAQFKPRGRAEPAPRGRAEPKQTSVYTVDVGYL